MSRNTETSHVKIHFADTSNPKRADEEKANDKQNPSRWLNAFVEHLLKKVSEASQPYHKQEQRQDSAVALLQFCL